MKPHIFTATIIFALALAMLTACFGPKPDADTASTDANATDTNEVTLGEPDPETQPSQEETLRSKQADTNSGAGSDAGNGSDADDAADSGNTGSDAGSPGSSADSNTDAGSDARPGCDAGIDRTPDAGTPEEEPDTEPDAGTPDSPPPAPTYIFETEEHGVLVEADEDTIANSTDAPAWSTQAIASAEFTRPSGKTYTMLVYAREAGERFADWMKRSEVGDAFISTRTVETSDSHTGYVYETNDMAAIPAVHVTVPTRDFVYYFQSDEESFAVPEDFLNFIRELELQ